MPKGRREKSLLLAIVILMCIAVCCGIISSRYTSKANELWNSVGYDKAYKDLLKKAKTSKKAVSEDEIAQMAMEQMSLPKYVPEASRTKQRTANLVGLVGFFSVVLVVVLMIVYLRGVLRGGRPADGAGRRRTARTRAWCAGILIVCIPLAVWLCRRAV